MTLEGFHDRLSNTNSLFVKNAKITAANHARMLETVIDKEFTVREYTIQLTTVVSTPKIRYMMTSLFFNNSDLIFFILPDLYGILPVCFTDDEMRSVFCLSIYFRNVLSDDTKTEKL